MNKLCPENDEGNIEYKRFLINLDEDKLEHLATQMKWRLYEGNNNATYYLGVDDNGTPYKLTNREKKETLENFMRLLEKTNSEIINFDTIKYNNISYFKIDIKKKIEIYPEIRVILLGDSQTGKTTFLSNIILNKTNINNDARIYMLNHKHELESKRTSSINYSSLIYENKRYIFIEAPGHEEYLKTKYKILLGTNPHIALIFINNQVKNNDILYCQKMNIPYITIDIFNNQKYNCNEIINRNKLFYEINQNIKVDNNSDISLDYTKLIILNIYPHNDFGIIISGYLASGQLEINQNINLVYNISNNIKIIKFKIKTIHINGESVKKILSNHLVSISMEKTSDSEENVFTNFDNKLKKNIKTGIIVDRIPNNYSKLIKFKIFSNINLDNYININGYCENRTVQIRDIQKNNDYYTGTITNYYNEKYIIIDNENGIIIID